jgi:hypothetical protein
MSSSIRVNTIVPSSGSNVAIGTTGGSVDFNKINANVIEGSCLASTSDVNGTHTTGSVTSGSASLTVASATGIVAGMYIVGEGIVPGTTVSSISGTTVTMSANAAATLSSDPVSFYVVNKILTPGIVAGQLCRAWVNFDGTGTVAIRASFNVSSITDNGTGDYTINFTNAMTDANYSSTVTANNITNVTSIGDFATDNSAKSPSAYRVIAKYVNIAGSNYLALDPGSVSIAIFR